MPAAVLTKGEWEEVKMASIAGIPDSRLAKEWGIEIDAIKQRRRRGNWATKNKALIEQQKAMQALKDKGSPLIQSMHGAEEVSPDVTGSPKALDLVSKSLGEYADGMALALVPTLSSLAENAVTKNPALFAPTDLKELGQSVSLVWKLTGRDKPQTEVNVSLWSTQQPQSERDVTPSHADDVMDSMLD
jgi:hypothetical protein